VSKSQTAPVGETVAWDELRPPCSCARNDGPVCGSPAVWWDSCAGCGGIAFACDPCHEHKLVSGGKWLHASGCGRTFQPARRQIAAMGRI
jgi:hypothetical protein